MIYLLLIIIGVVIAISTFKGNAKTKRKLSIFLMIGLVAFLIYAHWESTTHQYIVRLKPAIRFVENTLEKTGRLPTEDEFNIWKKHDRTRMYTLLDMTDPYAQSKGAIHTNDYLLGTWKGDWYHFYKSWDKKYYDGYDEHELKLKEHNQGMDLTR